MRAATRAFLAVVLVVVMAGSGVAFAVGVNFTPRATVCTPSGIPGYGPVCTSVAGTKKHKKHKRHHKHHVKAKRVIRAPAFTG
jgi:hypothetical protein